MFMWTHQTSAVFRIAAPAKLNLFLEILGKRSDGYHEIETVMAPISWYDGLAFAADQTGRLTLSVRGGGGNTPADERNLVVRALQLVQEWANNHLGRSALGARIWLDKRIPAAAGLGGASSDAAASIIAANQIWQLGLSHNELVSIAAQIGSDVPFFLQNRWAKCSGRGEKVSPIAMNGRLHWVIAHPPVGLPTARVYASCSVPNNPKNSNQIRESLRNGRNVKIGKLLFNRLQGSAMTLEPWVSLLERAFAETSSLGHQMTGSGSGYFGIYSNRKVAIRAARCLSNRLPDVTIFSGHTIGAGGMP